MTDPENGNAQAATQAFRDDTADQLQHQYSDIGDPLPTACGTPPLLHLARGSEPTDTAVIAWPVSWPELVATLSTPTTGSKAGSYFLRGACPGKRANGTMSESRDLLIVIDGDTRMDPATGGEPDLVLFEGEVKKDHALACCDPQAVHQALIRADVTHVIYTTASHGKRGPDWHKWRVVIPSNATGATLEGATRAVFDTLWDASLYVWPVAESFTVAQPWFFPRLPADRIDLFYVAHHDGRRYEVAAPVLKRGNLEGVTKASRIDKPQHRDVIGKFNDANPLQTMLTARGYSQLTARRFFSPHSTTGVAGVVILANSADRHFYVHNSSDPMKDGKKHDAFDLLCMVDHRGDFPGAYSAACASLGLPDRAPTKPAPKLAANDAGPLLPAFPGELVQLPHGLRLLQDWIVGYMDYPSRPAAGVTALATLSHFAMAHIKIDSKDGLGLNEQYLMLAPTGFGKEDLRKPFAKIENELRKMPTPPNADLWLARLPKLQYSAPASQQGLHRLLEAKSAQTFLADEFAEWLGHAASDGHKQQALGHIMQAYSKAFGTLAAPAIATSEANKGYTAVENPRVLIFATSTAARILETMNASQADSGALNRFVMLVAEQERIAKRYDVTSAAYIPPSAVIDMVAWIVALPSDTLVRFTPQAWAFYQIHDDAVLEPLKHTDNRLAGRLNAQAFKMAALVALSDRRIVIEERDLVVAYAIREGLYYRSAALIREDGAISGMHGTGKAYEQLALAFTRHAELYTSNLQKWSRMYQSLSTGERASVVRSLIDDGHCFRKADASNCLVSNTYESKAA